MKLLTEVATLATLLSAAGCAHNAAQAEPVAESLDLDEHDPVAERACTPSATESASASGRIATSPGPGHAIDFGGDIVSYPIGSSTAPTVKTGDGTLHVTANVPVAEKAQYVGVVLSFPKCIDASAFSGVRFSIRGSYRGCSMQYATSDVGHEDRHNSGLYATGKKGAYPPQTQLENSQVGAVAQTVTVPFSESTIRGNPPQAIDRSKLTGVLWQLTVAPAANIEDGTTACVADLNIDDVKFY